jgi:hypothetical protein
VRFQTVRSLSGRTGRQCWCRQSKKACGSETTQTDSAWMVPLSTLPTCRLVLTTRMSVAISFAAIKYYTMLLVLIGRTGSTTLCCWYLDWWLTACLHWWWVVDCLPSLVISGWLLAFTGDGFPTPLLRPPCWVFHSVTIWSAPHRHGYNNQSVHLFSHPLCFSAHVTVQYNTSVRQTQLNLMTGVLHCYMFRIRQFVHNVKTT